MDGEIRRNTMGKEDSRVLKKALQYVNVEIRGADDERRLVKVIT